MYGLFQRILKKDFKIYLEEKGFCHYKDETFICVYNDLFFMLSFDKGSYGTILEFDFSLGVPIVQHDFLTKKDDLDRLPAEGYSLSNAKWELERYSICDPEVKKKKINEYIEEIKYVYENYIVYCMSKVINLGTERYIQHEYNALFDNYLEEIGEEDPAWKYSMEFLASGKPQEEWSVEDDEKCKLLTKEKQEKEFPYEKVKQEILHTIEKNRPIYEGEIVKHFGKNYLNIVIDKEVLPATLEKVILDGGLKQKILEIGFDEYLDKNLQGVQNYGESLFFKKDDIELRVNLKDELFLDFIIIKNGQSHRVNVYDGNYFWFGWLVGKENIFEENINKAFQSLDKALKNN